MKCKGYDTILDKIVQHFMKYAHFLSKESAKRKTIPPTRPSIKTANKNTYTRLCLKIKKIHQPIYLKFMN